MTQFWSFFIAGITLVTLFACAALLFWCVKNREDVADGEEIEHEIDGIRELNNPLPKWWSYMFIATILFALFYLAAYGLGGFTGFLGWTSSAQQISNIEQSDQQFEAAGINQYARELDAAEVNFGKVLRALTHEINSNAELPIETIARNPEAIKVGQRLYLQNCAQCHGADARGYIGFPNLTDDHWLYGGKPEEIEQSIYAGRIAQMPAWEAILGSEGVEEVVSYTLSLSGRKVNILQARQGKARFVVCAACHGADGKGNQSLGAPNLTDNHWLYGGSRADVTYSVAFGRQGVMPAWGPFLTQDKIALLTAYVWSLSQPTP